MAPAEKDGQVFKTEEKDIGAAAKKRKSGGWKTKKIKLRPPPIISTSYLPRESLMPFLISSTLSLTPSLSLVKAMTVRP
jgi:hypothetical protein